MLGDYLGFDTATGTGSPLGLPTGRCVGDGIAMAHSRLSSAQPRGVVGGETPEGLSL